MCILTNLDQRLLCNFKPLCNFKYMTRKGNKRGDSPPCVKELHQNAFTTGTFPNLNLHHLLRCQVLIFTLLSIVSNKPYKPETEPLCNYTLLSIISNKPY